MTILCDRRQHQQQTCHANMAFSFLENDFIGLVFYAPGLLSF